MTQKGYEENVIIGLLPFIVQVILSNAYSYEEKIEIIVEALELIKQYPFKISVLENRNDLVVYQKDNIKDGLGFHINPYNLDSHFNAGQQNQQSDLFAYLVRLPEK